MNPAGSEQEKLFRTVRIMSWIVLVGLPLIYLAVAALMDVEKFAPDKSDQFMIRILFIIGLVMPVMIPVLERVQIKSLRANPDAILVAGQLFQTLSLTRAAFVEGTYLFGIVTYLITGDILQMLWFYPVGIIWSIIFWPRQAGYRRLIEKLNMP